MDVDLLGDRRADAEADRVAVLTEIVRTLPAVRRGAAGGACGALVVVGVATADVVAGASAPAAVAVAFGSSPGCSRTNAATTATRAMSTTPMRWMRDMGCA